MKHLIFTISLCLVPYMFKAQSTLSGNISYSYSDKIDYCKILLIKDSVSINSVVTDSLGYFKFENLINSEYELKIIVPLKTIDTLINISGNTLFNFTINDESEIEEIFIVAKQKTLIHKVDRTIFNPSNIPALVGGNATDVIEFAPGVFINGDNIQLSNGATARVMLNDKLIPLTGSQLISFIKSIPTEDIQYIEIIPVPPVKYAASSSNGLINIQLVIGSKSKLSKGSITSDSGQKYYFQQEFSASYSYRKNRFSLYSNFNIYKNKYHPYGDKKIEFDTLDWNEKYTTINNYKGSSGAVGINYEINPKTEIGLLYFANYYDYGTENKSDIINSNKNNLILERIENFTVDYTKNQKNAVNLNLISHLDSNGRKLDVNFDFTNFYNNGSIQYNTRYLKNLIDSSNVEKNLLIRSANLFSGGIDYVHPIKKVTLSLGARYSFTSNKYNLSVFKNSLAIEDTSKSNDFNYDEHIQALYSSLDWKINNWSFQLGFRGENTIYFGESPTTGLFITNNYFQLIPKLFLMYQTKNGKFWNFSYTRDFSRPSYDELNPFKYYTSSYQYKVGNPNLKPSVFHSISISTISNNITVSLNADYSNKGTTSITTFDELTQNQRTTTSNLYTSQGLTLFSNYYKSVNKRLSLDFNVMLSLRNTKVTQDIAPQNLTVFTGFANIDIRYILDKKESFILRLSGRYITPYFQQITRQTEFPYMTFSLSKNMLHNRLFLKFSFNDPFRLMKLKSVTKSNQTIVTDNNYFDTQSIFLTVSFRFGNNNMNVNQHSTNSTGEGGRLGK